jgi:flagellar basal body rod protein FlgB
MFIQEWFQENAAYLNHLKHLYTYIQNIIQGFQYRTHLGKTKDNITTLAILTKQLYELEKNENTIRLDYEHANMKKEKLIFHKQLTEIQNYKKIVISKLKGE